MSRSTGATVKVHLIQDYPSLLALKPNWDAVWSGSRHRWPSTTWTWIASWWQNLRDDQNLVVLEVRREGRPIGFAPFSWRSRFVGCSRQAEFAASGLVDFGDFASIAAEEEAVTAALAQHFVERGEWESLSLERLLWPHERIEAWAAPFSESNQTVTILSSASTWQVSLREGWDDFTSRLGARWRKHLRRNQRQLQQQGAVLGEAHSVEEAREILRGLYHLRTQTDEKEALPRQVERHFHFHSGILGELMKHGLAHLFSLKVDGALIAADYVFRYGDSFLYYLPAYSREWKEYSPGNVLLAYCIESAIQAGLPVLDLGIGDEDYKRHWLAQPVATQKVIVQSRRVGSRMRRGVDRCARAGNQVFQALKNLVA